jgi:hypothetical protein
MVQNQNDSKWLFTQGFTKTYAEVHVSTPRPTIPVEEVKGVRAHGEADHT